MLPAVAVLVVGGAVLYGGHKALTVRRRLDGLGRPLHPSVARDVLVIEHQGAVQDLRDRVARRLRALPQVVQVDPVELNRKPGLHFRFGEPDATLAIRFSRQVGAPRVVRLDIAGADVGLWPLDRRLSAAVVEVVGSVLPEHERLIEPEAALT